MSPTIDFDVSPIVEEQEIKPIMRTLIPRPVKKATLIKRDMTQGEWCRNSLPIERKRVHKNSNEGEEKVPWNESSIIETSSPIQTSEEPKQPSVLKQCQCNEVNKEDSLKSSFQSNNQRRLSKGSNVFDRLYENRPTPDPSVVAKVQLQRQLDLSVSSNKKPPKPLNCPFHEPPSKRVRFNITNDSSIADQNVSVFERLYAQRKQRNTKQLTDSQKREVYLREQRAKWRAQQAAKKKNNCQTCCHCGGTLIDDNKADRDVTSSSKEDSRDKTDQSVLDSVIDSFNKSVSLITPDLVVDICHLEKESRRLKYVLGSVNKNVKSSLTLCFVD